MYFHCSFFSSNKKHPVEPLTPVHPSTGRTSSLFYNVIYQMMREASQLLLMKSTGHNQSGPRIKPSYQIPGSGLWESRHRFPYVWGAKEKIKSRNRIRVSLHEFEWKQWLTTTAHCLIISFTVWYEKIQTAWESLNYRTPHISLLHSHLLHTKCNLYSWGYPDELHLEVCYCRSASRQQTADKQDLSLWLKPKTQC